MSKIRRAIAMTTATLALAAGATLTTGGSALATTHPQPQLKVGNAVPTPGLQSTAGKWSHTAPQLAAGCGWIYIGQPGNYGTPDGYAGQVEQMYNSCNGDVYAHWQWDSSFQQRFPYRQLRLAVGSPYYNNGNAFWTGVVYAYQGQDEWFQYSDGSGVPHGWANPDAWRAGAELDLSGCVAWGTLHWYGGQDWAGPAGGCGDTIVPA
ncbi:hypothetical protein [Kitasatospora sp. McL0602]|uniref:hypothetical protein n=1 Tax=Kitasatospora sp. McL0602 TaxID=3439530 RepID=UPI003F895A59